MKIALILVVFSSSVIGVFADTDKVKSVSVMEGDSVTLHTGVTKIQGSDSIEWRFNGTRMAKIDSDSPRTEGPFRDTMKLNNITGELKITDVRPTDSGLYKLKIKSSSGSPEMTFSVTVISSGVKSASVTEGDSVTLRSGVNGLQRDDVIRWRHQNILIADIINETPSIHTYNSESLKLDKQTGTLTIKDIRTEDAGDYEVDITISSSSSSKSRYTIHKSFSVNVSDELKSVTEGDSVTLNSGLTVIQRDNVIRWRFKKTIIAEIIKADQRFFTDDYVLDGRFKDRLKLDNRTGSLTITNIRNTDSGDYEVEISTNRFTVHKRISITTDDAVKSVSVTEGDSVTLNSGLTEIQRDDEIRWSFGKTIIAEIIKADQPFPTDDGPDGRFKDRLKLDHQTGSLTITNTRITDSGVYKVEISTNRFTVHKRISVTIDEAVNSVLVKEGDSVTLHTGASEIQGYDPVLWYGDNTLITGSVDPRWKNTVQNGQTGDLTIRNIRRDQSGDYKVFFVNINGVSKYKKFHINITGVFSDETDGVKTVSVMKGDSVFLDTSVTEIQNGDLIEWLFGPQNIIIVKTDGKSNIIYNENDVRFKNRLNLDNQTGDLTIENSNSEDSGRYQLKIISSTYTIQKSFSVTVHSGLSSGVPDLDLFLVVPDSRLPPAVPDSRLPPGAEAGIVVAVLLVAAAAVGVIYYRRRSSKPARSSEVNGQNHTSDKDEETELNKPT